MESEATRLPKRRACCGCWNVRRTCCPRSCGIQNMLEKKNGDWLCLTTKVYYRPNGRMLQRPAFGAVYQDEWGVSPDRGCVFPQLPTVVDHVRLFRNHPQIRWSYRVHEQILPGVRQTGGTVRWTDIVIQHVGYQDTDLRRKKLDRDLRLLQLQDAERPDEPFTLFNLGSVYQELGRSAEALGFLQRSLALSQPADSIVRKLYALIAVCQRELGRNEEALATCRKGRGHYADDIELLFQEGVVLRELSDLDGAEKCFQELLQTRSQAHFASVDTGLRGYKARHILGVVYEQQGRFADAEIQWRAAVAEQADFSPAWLGLGDLYLKQGRWRALEQAIEGLAQDPHGVLESTVLRAQGHLARQEFAEARRILEETIGRHPQALRPRIILTHVLLQEGKDWAAAEQALRDVLALDPQHKEAQRNLAILLRQRGAANGASS
jgi:tetratricopeptide (TPR) repeat protein